MKAEKTAREMMALAQEFQVPSSLIQRLRNKKRWGEIATELALAQHLSKTDPAGFPSTRNALAHVEQLRRKGNGWGEVVRELNVSVESALLNIQKIRTLLQESPA